MILRFTSCLLVAKALCPTAKILYVETEMHDVAILRYIVFSFDVHLAGLFAGGFLAVMDVIFVFDYFGADKSFFKVGVDDSCALGSFAAFQVGPGLDFLRAGGKVGL